MQLDYTKIKLRTLQLSDKSELAKLLNNPKVCDNLRDHIPFPYSKEDADFFINLCLKENPQQNFAIDCDGKLCGVIGLVVQSGIYRKSAEIGYWLGEPFWGKGIATIAVDLISIYGFEKLDLIRIYTGVFAFNIASMKVLEKNGFLKEGVFKNALIKNDKICDEHRYYKLKNM